MNHLAFDGYNKKESSAETGSIIHSRCQKCKAKHAVLQRASVSSKPGIIPSIHEVLRSPGQPLDQATRTFMESHFSNNFSEVKTHAPIPQPSPDKMVIGPPNDPLEHQADQLARQLASPQVPSKKNPQSKFNFSNVRVHTDAQAMKSARMMNALAYTVGQHIAFGEGQYTPGTSSGRYLLAHELAHTVQQGGNLYGMFAQRMAPCPPTLNALDPVPHGWKPYHSEAFSALFHCGYRGILEDRPPSLEDPMNECFYDDNGVLVDKNHIDAGCMGTPDQYDSKKSLMDLLKHTFLDKGGVWSEGWGAFWSSRAHDLRRNAESEDRCRERCYKLPLLERGICIASCNTPPPTLM